MFYGCSALESLILPGSMNGIGEEAFSGCSRLESIKIPKDVTEIGANAFYLCDAVMQVKKGSYAETYMQENGISYETY